MKTVTKITSTKPSSFFFLEVDVGFFVSLFFHYLYKDEEDLPF